MGVLQEGMEIVAPASIANLGPGLDTLAVAVRLFLKLRVRRIDAASSNQLKFHFSGMQLNGENYIERAFRFLLTDGMEFPGVELDVETEIPMAAGLGSSAAATIAGLRLFEAVFGSRTQDELLAAACTLEGHPENAAAALMGGLVVCCQKVDGGVIAVPWEWPDAVEFLVLTPAKVVSTKQSRQLLPKLISLRDAVFNVQHVACFLAALRAGSYSHLREALRDRLHQPFRSEMLPELRYVVDIDHPSVLGACLSGSGPSVAMLVQGEELPVEEFLAHIYGEEERHQVQVRRLRVCGSDSVGAMNVVPSSLV